LLIAGQQKNRPLPTRQTQERQARGRRGRNRMGNWQENWGQEDFNAEAAEIRRGTRVKATETQRGNSDMKTVGANSSQLVNKLHCDCIRSERGVSSLTFKSAASLELLSLSVWSLRAHSSKMAAHWKVRASHHPP